MGFTDRLTKPRGPKPDPAPRYTREQVNDALHSWQVQGRQRAWEARQKPAVIRAAGQRIERMSAERMRALAGSRQSWQALAWGYRDMIGELRFALQFRARAISRVAFFVAELLDGDDDEPIPLALRNEVDTDGQPTERARQVTLPGDICTAAEQELARLPLGSGMEFLGSWSENFDVTGECWLYGYIDDGEEVWEIHAFDDVEVQGDRVTIKDDLDQPKVVNLDPDSSEELYRLWVRHPRKRRWADSALHACMDSLEDITLIGRELRAASRSRIASNGVAFFPLDFLENQNVREDDETQPQDKFVTDFTAALLAPITNEGDAGAVVPAALFASIEAIEGFRFERFDREDSPTLIAKLDRALGRMGQSLDLPPEIITGMAAVNHWSAWQIDAATVKHYIEPGVRLMADSLTIAFLRHKLKALGFPAEQVNRVRVWYSTGQITENPNRRQDAIDAYDRLSISRAALRDALGFNDGDAATAEEIIQIIAAKHGIDTAVAAQLLAYAAEQEGAELPDLSPATIAPTAGQRALPPPPQADSDPTGTGGGGAPDTAPTSVTAAAPPPYRVDTVLGQELAEIERVLRERVLLASEEALTRAIEKASSRLRSKAQRDPQLTAALRTTALRDWGLRIGREQAFGLGADVAFLFKEAWNDLRERITAWTREAVGRVITKLARLTGPDLERVEQAMASRMDAAWERYADQLTEHASRRLFRDAGTGGSDSLGETPTVTVPPALVRAALAHIGGLPETAGGLTDRNTILTGEAITGLADGTVITHVLAEHDIHLLGREWRYNPLLERNTFLPHYDLDGTRFTSWTDAALATEPADAWIGHHYRPGDHQGCLCDSIPAYLVPAQRADSDSVDPDVDALLAQQVRDRLAQPSQAMAELIVLAESDDRAGRRGTSAQAARDQWLEIQALQRQYLNGDTQ